MICVSQLHKLAKIASAKVPDFLQDRLRRLAPFVTELPSATETLTTPRIRTENTLTTFGYCTRTKIGFWNVRTLLDAGSEGPHNARFLQLEREFVRYKMDILGLSEVRWLGSGKFKSPSRNTVLLYSGKPQGSAREAGVGLLLTKTAISSLISWEPLGERIIKARFRTRVRPVTIIQCYAPTELASDEEKECFYSRLGAAYNNTPRGDIKMVMGDLNAKVGSSNDGLRHVMGNQGVGSCNDNGERFIDFCNANGLVIGGTMFEHKTCHKISWVSTDRQATSNQIDHFAISRRFRSSLLDVRNRRGADMGLARDHHLMVATVRLRTAAVRRSNGTTRMPKFKVDRLKDPSTRQQFRDHLSHEMRAISSTEPDTIENHWSAVKNAFITSAERVVGRAQGSNNTWLSEETWVKINERKEMKARLTAVHGEQRHELESSYRTKKREVHRSVRRDKRNHINALAQQAEDAANRCDSRTVYSITKELIGSRSSKQHLVKDVDGSLLSSDEEQLRRWKDHFASVLNRVTDSTVQQIPNELPEATNSRIRTAPPSRDEICTAIKALKTNKAVGLDGIPAELLQAAPTTASELLQPLIQAAWDCEGFPDEWKKGMIVKLPKKGDLTKCENWRGICVLPTVAKIVAKIVLERIREHLEATLDAEQAGFRAGSSCIDHINTLRIIIEQCVEYRSPLHLLFIDFEKAFDSVNREFIWHALRRRGIPDKLIAIIKATYEGSKCHVLHEGRLSEEFEVQSGVRQGCILSPILFLLVISDVLRAALTGNGGIQWTLTSYLKHLDYADDVCLLSHRIMDLHQMTTRVEREAEIVGLNINIGKTKMMSLGTQTSSLINISQQPVEKVQNFQYLGSIISTEGGTEQDICSRIGKAKAAFGMLKNIWRNNSLSLRTKLRLFRSNVESVLLYGCSTWKVTAAVTKKLQTFVNRCLRNILRIFWPNRISNEELLRRTGQEPIDSIIRRRKWQWIGHTLRKGNDCIATQAMQWNPLTQEGRRAGRPRSTWRRTVEEESAQLGKSWRELKHISGNRTRWRVGVVEALCPSRGPPRT